MWCDFDSNHGQTICQSPLSAFISLAAVSIPVGKDWKQRLPLNYNFCNDAEWTTIYVTIPSKNYLNLFDGDLVLNDVKASYFYELTMYFK